MSGGSRIVATSGGHAGFLRAEERAKERAGERRVRAVRERSLRRFFYARGNSAREAGEWRFSDRRDVGGATRVFYARKNARGRGMFRRGTFWVGAVYPEWGVD